MDLKNAQITRSGCNMSNSETEISSGKRKALAKKAEKSSTVTTVPSSNPGKLMECWDAEQQSIALLPASRILQLYDASNPLLFLDYNKRQ